MCFLKIAICTRLNSLYLLLSKELHVRECSDDILFNHLSQFIILEELVPRALQEREGCHMVGNYVPKS